MNFNKLDEFLLSLEKRGMAGTDCAIYLDGSLVHRHMQGLADREQNVPITNSTLYRMYSMTKPVTCVAMLQLYEQGRFLLTDPVGLYLPEFAHMTIEHHHPAETATITMWHLFTMTAGLSYNLETEPLQKLYHEKPERYTTREFVSALAQSPLLFPPGEHWYYSLAHDVLAACVEVFSGLTFGEYLKQNIFDPLGMNDVYFHVPENQMDRSCVRYFYKADKDAYIRDSADEGRNRFNRYQQSRNFESGGAGLTTTVDEYAKFANMLTHRGVSETGRRVIGAATLDLMRENHLTNAQMLDYDWIQSRGYGYGLGVRTLISCADAGSCGSLGEYGWAGAAGTYFLSDPERKLTIVYGQQASPSDEEFVHNRLRNIIYAALEY